MPPKKRAHKRTLVGAAAAGTLRIGAEAVGAGTKTNTTEAGTKTIKVETTSTATGPASASQTLAPVPPLRLDRVSAAVGPDTLESAIRGTADAGSDSSDISSWTTDSDDDESHLSASHTVSETRGIPVATVQTPGIPPIPRFEELIAKKDAGARIGDGAAAGPLSPNPQTPGKDHPSTRSGPGSTRSSIEPATVRRLRAAIEAITPRPGAESITLQDLISRVQELKLANTALKEQLEAGQPASSGTEEDRSSNTPGRESMPRDELLDRLTQAATFGRNLLAELEAMQRKLEEVERDRDHQRDVAAEALSRLSTLRGGRSVDMRNIQEENIDLRVSLAELRQSLAELEKRLAEKDSGQLDGSEYNAAISARNMGSETRVAMAPQATREPRPTPDYGFYTQGTGSGTARSDSSDYSSSSEIEGRIETEPRADAPASSGTVIPSPSAPSQTATNVGLTGSDSPLPPTALVMQARTAARSRSAPPSIESYPYRSDSQNPAAASDIVASAAPAAGAALKQAADTASKSAEAARASAQEARRSAEAARKSASEASANAEMARKSAERARNGVAATSTNAMNAADAASDAATDAKFSTQDANTAAQIAKATEEDAEAAERNAASARGTSSIQEAEHYAEQAAACATSASNAAGSASEDAGAAQRHARSAALNAIRAARDALRTTRDATTKAQTEVAGSGAVTESAGSAAEETLADRQTALTPARAVIEASTTTATTASERETAALAAAATSEEKAKAQQLRAIRAEALTRQTARSAHAERERASIAEAQRLEQARNLADTEMETARRDANARTLGVIQRSTAARRDAATARKDATLARGDAAAALEATKALRDESATEVAQARDREAAAQERLRDSFKDAQMKKILNATAIEVGQELSARKTTGAALEEAIANIAIRNAEMADETIADGHRITKAERQSAAILGTFKAIQEHIQSSEPVPLKSDFKINVATRLLQHFAPREFTHWPGLKQILVSLVAGTGIGGTSNLGLAIIKDKAGLPAFYRALSVVPAFWIVSAIITVPRVVSGFWNMIRGTASEQTKDDTIKVMQEVMQNAISSAPTPEIAESVAREFIGAAQKHLTGIDKDEITNKALAALPRNVESSNAGTKMSAVRHGAQSAALSPLTRILNNVLGLNLGGQGASYGGLWR